MPGIVADGLYPPLAISARWGVGSIALLVAVVGGYWLVRFIRTKLALRAQQRLALLKKPHRDMLIAKALQEIQQIRTAVESGSLPPDVGAERVSIVVRTVFDTLMNHRTAYQAKFEVAQRELQTMFSLLDVTYPTEFSRSATPQFTELCTQAVRVVRSCN